MFRIDGFPGIRLATAAVGLVLIFGCFEAATASSDRPSDQPDAAGGPDVDPGPELPSDPGASELARAINAHRVSIGLAPIPHSPALTRVADLHVEDLATRAPHEAPGCNLHSWSLSSAWEGCCYTSDHARAECMWNKPNEIAGYASNGYEIAAAGVRNVDGTVRLWLASEGHRAVIENEDIWAEQEWMAMGAAIRDGFATAWFGTELDVE